MSQTTALVVCRACAGTGLGHHNDAGYREDCGECLGQCHVAVNRERDGGLPDGETEWRGWTLGPVIPNPYRLTYATAQARE